MAKNIQIQSFNELVGAMLRTIIAQTPLNDVNVGSTLLSLIEAAAANDYDNSVAILNILELLNIDAIKNNDLDARAADFGLVRRSAVRASGLIDIINTNIVKRSTGLYIVRPAPIAGQTILYVNNTKGWANTGTLYIGRGTNSFEGPINYTAINAFPTYSEIILASALQKDHLISDIVVDSQGQPDRLIPAGTRVLIPANNLNPEVFYTTLRDAILPAGEDRVRNIEIIAEVPGSAGNAPINSITEFAAIPFTGAAVTNTTSLTNGKDVETDNELRNRLKSYTVTLARGTAPSIIEAVIGLSDPDDNKQVASAKLIEPVKVGEPSILYVDTGGGFQPSYNGQNVDVLLNNAVGSEEFLQLSNFPLPRPQVVNTVDGPFTIPNGSFLKVEVDDSQETVTFLDSDFLNPAAATVSEIIAAINKQATIFKARFDNASRNILLYAEAFDAETIRVSPLSSSDNAQLYVNSILKFPTNEFSYISLYQNSTRLREKEKSAQIETSTYSTWNILNPSNIIISVDGTPPQDRTFLLSDFPGATSFSSLTLEQWVTAFNNKFAGLTASATSSQTMIIKSNKLGAESKIDVLGGSILPKWFPTQKLSITGQNSEFELNRQTGNLRILTNIEPGDIITAGSEDTKGFVISAPTPSGVYNVSIDADGRPAELVIVTDSTFCQKRNVNLIIGSTITINKIGNNAQFMSSVLSTFAELVPGDWVYFGQRTVGAIASTNEVGLYKIVKKGQHLTANIDSYIEVENADALSGGGLVTDVDVIQAFSTDGYPQIWRGSYATNPPAETITNLINSLNSRILGIRASLFKSNSIKLTSVSEIGGSIAIPVSYGNMSSIFEATTIEQKGNPTHLASRISTKDLVSYFKRTTPTSTNVWLNRHTYSDLNGLLTDNATPNEFSTYSEIVESTGILTTANVDYKDYISFTKGNNRDQFRTIKAKLTGDKIGTQQDLARTVSKYVENNEFQLVNPIQLSSDDSIVAILDKDSVTKTIDVKLSRLCRVNNGSGMGSFLPTTSEISADDMDAGGNIDFSDPVTWSTSINKTDFADYKAWFRARNWYASGGGANPTALLTVRAFQYGPSGEKLRFNIIYPSGPDLERTYRHINTPSYSLFSYVFGSGPAKPILLSAGDTISVAGPYPDSSTNFPNGTPSSGNYFDYTFSTGDLSAVVVGDVLSINEGSGVSTFNRGQFRIANRSGLTVRVFNPNGSITTGGTPEQTLVTAQDEVPGTPVVYTIDTVADIAGSLHLKYFIIANSKAQNIGFWFDVNNTGAAPPTFSAFKKIKVANIVTGDSAATVANKIALIINSEADFSATVIGNQITVTTSQNNNNGFAVPGTSGFSISFVNGTNDVTVNGKYFIIYDDVGSVAVWYDIGNSGVLEPFHGANRSIKIDNIAYGSTADIIAAGTATILNADPKLSVTSSGAVINISRTFNGNVPNGNLGTTGWSTLTETNGSLGTAELITNASAINIFPLTGTSLSDIVDTVNKSQIILLTEISGSNIVISTEEEDYSYTGNVDALAYGHNPTSASLRDHIKLYDSENVVKQFSNNNPNFTFKDEFLLQNVNSSVYDMYNTKTNGEPGFGEYFKLIPVTIKNIHHHLTQKALSQLSIVANVNIASNRKNIQIVSKQLGSEGAIEVVGGTGNQAKSYILSESEVTSDMSGEYLTIKIDPFPDVFHKGDIIQIQNDSGIKRISRLISTDSIDVTNTAPGIMAYNFNAKVTNFSPTTEFTIVDVSASYSKSAGIVWRWTHDGLGGATLFDVRPGDLVMAYGPMPGWDQTNKVTITGDNVLTGFPIVAVNDSLNYFDVVNPFGKAMPTFTPIGFGGSAVTIHPSPAIKWQLAHAAKIKTISISRTSGTVTVTCIGPHYLNTGDNIDMFDSLNLDNISYGPITVTGFNTFTFSEAGSDFTELASGASIIKTGRTQTRYRLEKLNFNGMMRLSRFDGDSPMFADCGVAVDDYLSITGNTFKSNNNGMFRVLAVDNDSIIFMNKNATDELHTINNFNENSYNATWSSNNNFINGVAGTFRNVAVGDWVKKKEDPDSYYSQVVSINNVDPKLATQITIGRGYPGISGDANGITYKQDQDYDSGVILLNHDDITIYEGDSALQDDTLFVQNIVNSNWFSEPNTGSFPIVAVGISPTNYKPFIKVANANGIPESNRLMLPLVDGLYVIESDVNKFYSIRLIEHSIIDDLNPNRRSLYLTPSNRAYKFSNSNATSIIHLGKLNYSNDIVTGVDGYIYYTGLMRRVQRTVDGYEPDASNFPGRRAVGGAIESLPPLTRKISMAINITTDEGINLGEITNNIKSSIINYVNNLGVGGDVILSEIIAVIMNIKGVEAATFTTPAPSTERITIGNNEVASILPEDISIA